MVLLFLLGLLELRVWGRLGKGWRGGKDEDR